MSSLRLLLPLSPRSQYELLDHFMREVGTAPEAELAAVRPLVELRKGHVWVRADFGHVGFHIVPNADGVVPGVDRQRGQLDLLQLGWLQLQPCVAAVCPTKLPAQAQGLHS